MLNLDALGPAGAKLQNLLSAEEAAALLEEAIATLGPSSLDAPDRRYRFGEMLLKKARPVLRVMGRSIMAQAVLHGAMPPEH